MAGFKDRATGGRAKKDTRKYLQGKQGKTDEIRRALTHRARLRKNYFKLLEREGLDVPTKENTEVEHNREANEDEDENENEDEQQEQEQEQEQEIKRKIDDRPKDRRKSSGLEIEEIKRKVQNREALTYQERVSLKKNRKENDRQKKMNRTREKLDSMKQKELQRKRQTERLQNTKTRRGQPLMGPRISNLLEKIKQDKKV